MDTACLHNAVEFNAKTPETQRGGAATHTQGRKNRRDAMDAEISNRSLFSASIAPLRLNPFTKNVHVPEQVLPGVQIPFIAWA